MWEELFGDGPKAIVVYDPYKTNTELVVEAELVRELAGSMEAWSQRCWAERRMWVYLKILQDQKRSRQEQYLKEEHEKERERIANQPKVVKERPGITRR